MNFACCSCFLAEVLFISGPQVILVNYKKCHWEFSVLHYGVCPFQTVSFLHSLQAQQEEFWGDQVTVVSCDMRDWNSPEKADILISELLGSFGDNELSPECLDGAQKFLKGLYLKIILYGLLCFT
jgi:hypothetical protein